MPEIAANIDTTDGGVTFLVDTGQRTVSYEGDGAARVEASTPVIERVTYGAPPETFKGTAAEYRAQCRRELELLLAPDIDAAAIETAEAALIQRTPAPVEMADAELNAG